MESCRHCKFRKGSIEYPNLMKCKATETPLGGYEDCLKVRRQEGTISRLNRYCPKFQAKFSLKNWWINTWDKIVDHLDQDGEAG